MTRQRFDAGVSSELGLRQSETLVESAKVSVASLTRQRAQAENALTLLVGTSVGDLPDPRLLEAQDVETGIPSGLPSDLLQGEREHRRGAGGVLPRRSRRRRREDEQDAAARRFAG